jgi:serine/threonine protein kinase
MNEKDAELVPSVIGHKYHLDYKNVIGKGSFGWVFKVIDIETQEEYAAKIEKKERFSLLKFEYHVLKQLEGNVGFPKIVFYGEQSSLDRNFTFLILVMELLGTNLEDQYQKMGRSFSIPAISNIGIQILARLELMHEAGFIHRDIKPENFLFGVKKEQAVIYILDFGLSKRFKYGANEHIPFKTKRSLTGYLILFNIVYL